MRSGSAVRRAAKIAVLPAGAASRRRPGDVVILLYHRVGAGRGEISMRTEAFAEQLAHLAARERVLSLEAALEPESGGGVVITFDDGYRDFYEHVVPLLERHRLPAVLYLTTGSVGAGSDALSWSQLREAVAGGFVTVGAHTHTHADLSRAPAHAAELELRRSKETVEDRLGTACRHFAYPWAIGSAAADSIVRDLFDSAAWDAWRTNRRGRFDRYRLGRTPVLHSDGQLFFRAKVGALLDAEGLFYRAFGRSPGRPAGETVD